MSYILDALQRADAERARGNVPTLNARPVTAPLTNNGPGVRQRAGLVIAVALSVAAAGLVGWLWRPVAQLPAAAPAPAAAATAVLVPLPSPVTIEPRTVAPVTAATPSTANTKPANSASAAEPVLAVAPKAKTVVASAPVVAEMSAPAPTAAPLLSELPEATRREIPALVINGAVYSDNPAQRLLLVNGQVLNQGGEVAPDLKVVEIRSNSSEFSFRGTRFRLVH